MHFAAACGQLPTCKLLASHGVDPDVEDASGRAPLHYAAMGGSDDVVGGLSREMGKAKEGWCFTAASSNLE